jgi:hypothetical protein
MNYRNIRSRRRRRIKPGRDDGAREGKEAGD